MSEKFFVGRDIVSFSNNGKYKPISRVTLLLDDEKSLTAGDDTGLEIVASCRYGTQEMVNALLAQFSDYEYQAFEAGDAGIDPAAELGDGVTVNGIYGVIAQISDDGSGYPSLSAPGKAELEDEYPDPGPMTREFNRKIAETRTMISKTSSEIKLSVDGIKATVDGMEETVNNSLTVNEEGVIISNGSGTPTKINGGSIDADTLTVKAANITGTIKATVLMGSEVQLAYAQDIFGNPFSSGRLMISPATSADYAVDLQSDAALRLLAKNGLLYLSNNNTHVTFSGDTANPGTLTFGHVCPSQQGRFSCGTTYYYWTDVYAATAPTGLSDRNHKNSIEALPEKYLALFDGLTPVRYKLNEGTSGRYHVGFVAQDVEEAMTAAGIDSQEFGGFVKGKDADGNDIYMLRYEEFIAIILAAVQAQQKVIDDHEERLKKLEAMMNG